MSGVKMEALKFHTFGVPPKEYNEGDTYVLQDDENQTAEQYAETLTYLQFAKRVEKSAKKKADDSDDAPKKQTHVEPMSTETMKATAEEKQVEHRQPAKHVPTVKK